MQIEKKNYILLLLQLPFLLIIYTIKTIMFYISTMSYILTIFLYLITPFEKQIIPIYKFTFFLSKIFEILYPQRYHIVSSKKLSFILESYNNDLKLMKIKKKQSSFCIITSIHSFDDLLKTIKLTEMHPFVIYVTCKKDLSPITAKIVNYFNQIQNQSIKNKTKILIKIIIQNHIPEYTEILKKKSNNKLFFILEHKKNKPSLFY